MFWTNFIQRTSFNEVFGKSCRKHPKLRRTFPLVRSVWLDTRRWLFSRTHSVSDTSESTEFSSCLKCFSFITYLSPFCRISNLLTLFWYFAGLCSLFFLLLLFRKILSRRLSQFCFFLLFLLVLCFDSPCPFAFQPALHPLISLNQLSAPPSGHSLSLQHMQIKLSFVKLIYQLS